MAVARSITVLGLPEAEAKFAAINAKVIATLPLLLKAAALPVMNLAKINAPYLTGTLQKSIHIEATATGVTVGTDLVYAAAQEFGRPEINLPAHPYLRPAIDAAGPAAVLSMGKALAALLGGP